MSIRTRFCDVYGHIQGNGIQGVAKAEYVSSAAVCEKLKKYCGDPPIGFARLRGVKDWYKI